MRMTDGKVDAIRQTVDAPVQVVQVDAVAGGREILARV